ncbi:hypothetical protein KC957_04215 [Candidatus Saccharibacteria bacterium]|nr:hypothetical protein [Candidatus Saccharibacteria bacterium]
MIIVATLLLAFGLVTSLLGLKLFKLLLPALGLVSGFMIGFVGTQGVFGTGALSNAMAVLVALAVGVLLAVLSFLFFDVAIVVLSAIVGASALAYLGVALGLRQEGFVVFLLAVAGGILGLIAAQRYPIGVQLVVTLSSMLGVAYVLTGFMLVAGTVNLDQLNNQGVVGTLLRVVDQSFLWFFVWIGASLLAMQVQYRLAVVDALSSAFAYEESRANARRK